MRIVNRIITLSPLPLPDYKEAARIPRKILSSPPPPANLKSIFLTMLHETADSGQCSIAHMIGAGQESGYRLIKELIFHAFVHIAFFSSASGQW